MKELANRKGTKNGHYKGEELLQYKSMKNWFESLKYCAISRGKKGLSKGSRKQRLSIMANFVKYSKMNPDQLLAEAQRDINLTGKRLIDYFEKRLEDGLSRNSMVTRIGFLRGFYTHNNLFFPKKWRIPSRKKSKIRSADEQSPMFKKNGNGETELKTEVIQQFIQNLNFRDQTIALCLLSSGADAKDVLKLNFGFLKDVTGEISKEKRLLWHNNRAKDGIEFKVFLSQEATEFLKRYAEQVQGEQERNRKQGKPYLTIDDKTPLFFVTDFARGNFGKRLSVDSLASNFRESAKKMGYVKKGVTNPLRPKRFRHLFRNACSYAKIDDGWIHSMMGHVSTVSQSYLEKPVLMLGDEYAKLEPYVTVFGTGKDQVNEMTKEVTGLKDSVVDLVKKDLQLEAEVKDLKEQLKSATEIIYSFEPVLNTFGAIADTKEGQALIKKIKEAKAKQEMNELGKERAEITKEHPVSKNVKRE